MRDKGRCDHANVTIHHACDRGQTSNAKSTIISTPTLFVFLKPPALQSHRYRLLHTIYYEQDAVLFVPVCGGRLEESHVLHTRGRTGQGRQGHLIGVQSPPAALRRIGGADAGASQACLDARGDACDLQSDWHVPFVPQAGSRHGAARSTRHTPNRNASGTSNKRPTAPKRVRRL